MGTKGIIFYFFMLLLLLSVTDLLAQVRDNPFDLKPRLPEVSEEEVEIDTESGNPFDLRGRPVPDQAEVEATNNPFDIGEAPATDSNPFELNQTREKTAVSKKVKAKNSPKIAFRSLSEERNFVFILLLINGLLLTFTFTFFRSVYVKIYRALFNDNMLSLIHRESSSGAGAFANYLATYMIFFILAGSFAYVLGRYFDLIPAGNPWLYWVNCTVLIVSFFLMHHFLLYLIGNIFPAQKEASLYSFTVMIYSIISTIPLLIAFLCISYLPSNAIKYAVFGSLVALALIYLFRSIRGIYIGSRFLSRNTFHFFLYLCTVEIVPLMLLYKLVFNSL